jgi:tRNA threonylcarbamoyladenosine biosynthesis protein TsaB
MDTGHAEALMPMVERVMRDAGVAFGDLDAIVVTEGPGSFTGVRTGIAAARGLALATGARTITVSSLWAIAGGVVAELGERPAEFDGVLVAVDARKGQLYVQAVDMQGSELTMPQLVCAEDVARLCVGGRLIAAGNGASIVADAVRTAGREIALHCARGDATLLHVPDIRTMLSAAGSRLACERPMPLYLRPPDAKPQSAKSLPWSPP